MFFYVRDTALRLRQMGIELTKGAVNNIHRKVYKPNRTVSPQWEMNVRGKPEDLKWLL
jgi:hypothetical protein